MVLLFDRTRGVLFVTDDAPDLDRLLEGKDLSRFERIQVGSSHLVIKSVGQGHLDVTTVDNEHIL